MKNITIHPTEVIKPDWLSFQYWREYAATVSQQDYRICLMREPFEDTVRDMLNDLQRQATVILLGSESWCRAISEVSPHFIINQNVEQALKGYVGDIWGVRVFTDAFIDPEKRSIPASVTAVFV